MKKSSLLYNLLLTLGIVIGTGIFFKNMSIISAAHGNTTYVILGWTIGGMISLASALAFADISFKTKDTNNNLSEFYRLAFGEKFGKFSKLSFAFVYYPIYSFVIAVYSTKYLLELFTTDPTFVNTHTWLLILVAILITLVFIVVVNLSEKFSKASQTISTIIKLSPFVILVIIAFSAMFMTNNDAYWNKTYPVSHYEDSSYNQTNGMSGISVIFWVVPATKFAFDGFASVTANKRNTTPKNLKLGISFGMAIVTVIYLLNAVAILKEGELGAPEAMVKFFGGDPRNLTTGYNAIFKIIKVIIVISGLGALNSFTLVWKRSINQILIDRKIKISFTRSSFLMTVGLLMSTLPWTIASVAMYNQNVGQQLIGEISDIVLLVSFTINAIVFAKYLVMAYRKEMQLSKITIAALVIAIIGTGAVAAFKLVDDLFIEMILHWDNNLFGSIPRIVYLPIFIGVLLTFAIAPYLVNILLKTKKFNSNNKDQIATTKK